MTAHNAVAIREDKPMQLVKGFQSAIGDALPTHMTKEHFSRALLTSFRRTPALVQCEQSSIGNAVVTAAQLGLMIGVNGACWLIPYGKECQLIIGYQGLIDLCYRSGIVESIFADVVFENDIFDFEQGLKQTLRHKINLKSERGKPYAVYAIARIKKSDTPVYVVLTKDEVYKVRNSSAGAKSNKSPWNGEFETEMWKKTALRRLSKLLPKSIELQQALEFENRQEERWTSSQTVEDDPFAPGRHKLPSKSTNSKEGFLSVNQVDYTPEHPNDDDLYAAAFAKLSLLWDTKEEEIDKAFSEEGAGYSAPELKKDEKDPEIRRVAIKVAGMFK